MTPNPPPRTRRPARRRDDRGSILVEFAFIAFLMYLLIGSVVDFGRLFFTAQVAQDAARTGARELSVIPLPADMTLTQALADPAVRARVYRPEHLVIDLDNIPGGLTLDAFFGTLPVLNQALRPLMINDVVNGHRLLRYPGALLTAPTPSGYTVGVPIVEGRDANGVETIRWVPVVEEITNPDYPGVSPFQMNTPATMPQRGLVAVRINVPFQAAMLGGYREAAGGPGAPNPSLRIIADDAAVQEMNLAPGGLTAGSETGPYAGKYGMGRFYSAAKTIRPFRKLLAAQAIFRREVFELPQQN
jgi:hypothetical protein